jgi:hypothetical protein
MLAFAKAHKRFLWIEFGTVVLLGVLLLAGNWLWPATFNATWGWMLLFSALPWSAIALAIPQIGGFAMVIVILGAGLNAVVVTTVVWYALVWWLDTLRPSRDT